jgi:N-acetylmuramoyl-L-alanine amidase
VYRVQIALLILAAMLGVAALVLLKIKVPVPHFGRDYVIRFELPEAGQVADLPAVAGPQDPSRPLVVLDAGHGGHDPGAVADPFREKDITLGLAQALRAALLEQGGIRVALTREDDRFLVVEERAEIARQLGADLFVSIHADSAGERESVNGASIYLLSDKASSEAAARFAARENNAGRVNGSDVSRQNEAVTDILVDLSQRRSQADAAEFAGLVQREGTDLLEFHPQPLRSAALRVLRAPDVPSVLFEAGFITNSADAERLASAAGQRRYAQALASAIRVYFARRSGV